jgi:transcriptional regulator with XRE-family HTH domain
MTKLKLFRLERDLKAIDIAKGLNVHPSTISTVESGKARASDRVRLKLCKFYEVQESELFSNEFYAV